MRGVLIYCEGCPHILFSAVYIDSTGTIKECRVFIDTGWRESIPGYDSHPAEIITLISVLLEEIPLPKVDDQLQIEDDNYSVISIHSLDDVIAALQVRKI